MMPNKSPLPAVAPFPSWTFDKPCPTMVWNPLIASTELTVGRDHLEEADFVIVGVVDAQLEGFGKIIDQGHHGILTELLAERETQKAMAEIGGTSVTIRVAQPLDDQVKMKRYALLSLGKTKDSSGMTVATAGFAIGKAIATLCKTAGLSKLSLTRVTFPGETASHNDFLRNLATSFYSELYVDNRYRTGDNIVNPTENLKMVNLVSDGALADTNTIQDGKAIASGINLAKDIVQAPHNVLNTESLAETARRIADTSSCLTCHILDRVECEQRGMGAYLAVARGSETEPQFLHLTYRPPSGEINIHTKVGLVGKGVLFDTGGYNIKTQMMELMKFDCGGAAAILGAALALGKLQPPGVEVHFIVAACENMIGSKAYVPSDIVTASNGLTIEIKNTDAEGRLTLADALVYADQEVGCDKIVELSTLTGAIMVALGKEICGVMTQDDKLAEELQESAQSTAEKVWRLPMDPVYKELLKSSIADLNNLGDRYGQAMQAAVFLQHFVQDGKPFAHVDVAGTAWNEKHSLATGFGVKLVIDWVTKQGKR